MKILLTGASGHVGSNLLPLLIAQNHFVYVVVRDMNRFSPPPHLKNKIEIINCDCTELPNYNDLPQNIDAAYYFIHSLRGLKEDIEKTDKETSTNVITALKKMQCKQIIYLSGITASSDKSSHLISRKIVENILKASSIPLTMLKASIIIGSGSVSFEIIRRLCERFIFLTGFSWLNSLCQPISTQDVIDYLLLVLGNENCYNRTFEIGGADQISYKNILRGYMKKRHLFRPVIPLPFSSIGFSSFILSVFTSINNRLSLSLIESLSKDNICKENTIHQEFNKKCLNYDQCLDKVFQKIEQKTILAPWEKPWLVPDLPPHYFEYIDSPRDHCCLFYHFKKVFEQHPDDIFNQLVNTACKDLLWSKPFNRKPYEGEPKPGDVLGFWEVIIINKQMKRLFLADQFKILPGEAWLQFQIEEKNGEKALKLEATFRPKGLLGRIYWFVTIPIHRLIFNGMLKKVYNIKNTTT